MKTYFAAATLAGVSIASTPLIRMNAYANENHEGPLVSLNAFAGDTGDTHNTDSVNPLIEMNIFQETDCNDEHETGDGDENNDEHETGDGNESNDENENGDGEGRCSEL